MLAFMNTTSMYVINAILVLLVVRQIRERRLDLRGLAVPVLAVGAAALFFLHSVPGRGNDIPLELICASAGAIMGALAGLATHLRRDSDVDLHDFDAHTARTQLHHLDLLRLVRRRAPR